MSYKENPYKYTLNHVYDSVSGTWVPAEGNSSGNIKAVLVDNPDYGNLQRDAWASVKVSIPHSIFHGMWSYDIPLNMWFMYENGTQVYTSTDITSSGGAAKLLTTASNTVLLLESRECPRYQPNRGHLFSTAGWFPNKTNDGVRDFGLFTTENGVFFRLKADGKLYAVLRSGSSETIEEEIDTSVIDGFDVEKGNIYDIQYQWRGVGNYKFFIGDPATGAQKLVHTFNNLGTLTALSMEIPALPIAYKATRTTENVEMNIGCADITSENGQIDKEQYGSASAINVSINGTDVPVICIYNPLQINGETNTRTTTLARITVTGSKKGTFKVWTTRDPSQITGEVFAEPANNPSHMQSDSTDMSGSATRATAITTTNMNLITVIPVEAAVSRSVDNPYRGRIEFPLVRGDYLIVSYTASTATADVTIEWGEQI